MSCTCWMMKRRHNDELGLELGQLLLRDLSDAHGLHRHLVFALEGGFVHGAEPVLHKYSIRIYKYESERVRAGV